MFSQIKKLALLVVLSLSASSTLVMTGCADPEVINGATLRATILHNGTPVAEGGIAQVHARLIVDGFTTGFDVKLKVGYGGKIEYSTFDLRNVWPSSKVELLDLYVRYGTEVGYYTTVEGLVDFNSYDVTLNAVFDLANKVAPPSIQLPSTLDADAENAFTAPAKAL